MSSIRIKGQDMPKGCNDCAMSYISIDYDFKCVFTNDCVGNCIEHRLANCPLEEVHTPHGRLADVDKLYDIVETKYKFSSGKEHMTYRDILDLICSIETVIDAEE